MWKEGDDHGRMDLNDCEEEDFLYERFLCIYRTLLAAQKRTRTRIHSLPIIAYLKKLDSPELSRVLAKCQNS